MALTSVFVCYGKCIHYQRSRVLCGSAMVNGDAAHHMYGKQLRAFGMMCETGCCISKAVIIPLAQYGFISHLVFELEWNKVKKWDYPVPWAVPRPLSSPALEKRRGKEHVVDFIR